MRLPVELTVVEDCHICKGKALLGVAPGETPSSRTAFVVDGVETALQVFCSCVGARMPRAEDGGVG